MVNKFVITHKITIADQSETSLEGAKHQFVCNHMPYEKANIPMHVKREC